MTKAETVSCPGMSWCRAVRNCLLRRGWEGDLRCQSEEFWSFISVTIVIPKLPRPASSPASLTCLLERPVEKSHTSSKHYSKPCSVA